MAVYFFSKLDTNIEHAQNEKICILVLKNKGKNSNGEWRLVIQKRVLPV